jgi:hypothetical protein
VPAAKAKAKTDGLEIEFTKAKETKGTFVYAEDDDNPKIGSLYLKKAAAAELGNPEKLFVTVEVA